jgi:predicted phosphodiesterase
LKRVLIASDIHFPNHDPSAVATLLRFVRDYKPHQVVLNGDIMDFQGLSRHADASAATRVRAECEVAADFLDGLRREAGKGCRIDYNEGNHDIRLNTFVEMNAPQLGGLLTLTDLLGLKRRRIDFMPYSGDDVRFIGPKLGVTHGSFHGTNYTRETVLKYGVSLIVGHAHRPQHTSVPVVGPTGHHTRGCWGLGCLVPVGRVGYMRQPSGWTQGWGVAMVSDNGEFDVHHVNLTRGRVRWHNGKTYGQNGRVFGG